MLELFPDGFEEVESPEELELVAYTDAGGEERLWQAFGGARGSDVAEDWRDRWKAFHQPVRVGAVWIGPPWEDVPEDAIAVVVDPGRAFGTGTHPTTQLCIELLLELDPSPLVDVGCGSGVLAIAAAKLGFTPVTAVDSDENAVAATVANAAANAVEVEVRQLDARVDDVPAADLVVANITRAAVEQLAPRLRARRLVTSGYLPTDEVTLPGFRHLRSITRGGWAADLYEKT
jgi:ribosomal protein L11 methyltransferase